MSSCVRFPHRRELTPQRYVAYLIFLQSWTIESPLLAPPLFPYCSILAILFCGLVLLCGRSHVGVTCIFVMGWGILDHLIERRSRNVHKSTMLPSFHVWSSSPSTNSGCMLYETTTAIDMAWSIFGCQYVHHLYFMCQFFMRWSIDSFCE